MAKIETKEIILNFEAKEYLQDFIEHLSDVLKHAEFFLTYRSGKIRVKVVGERDVIADSVSLIKMHSKIFLHSVLPNNEGFYSHHISFLQKYASSIVTIDFIVSALKYSGYESYYRDSEIHTKATLDIVGETSEHLYELIQEITDIKGKLIREIILTVSHCKNTSPSFVLKKGIELKLFNEYKGKIIVTTPAEVSIPKLLEEISSSEGIVDKETVEDF